MESNNFYDYPIFKEKIKTNLVFKLSNFSDYNFDDIYQDSFFIYVKQKIYEKDLKEQYRLMNTIIYRTYRMMFSPLTRHKSIYIDKNLKICNLYSKLKHDNDPNINNHLLLEDLVAEEEYNLEEDQEKEEILKNISEIPNYELFYRNFNGESLKSLKSEYKCGITKLYRTTLDFKKEVKKVYPKSKL